MGNNLPSRRGHHVFQMQYPDAQQTERAPGLFYDIGLGFDNLGNVKEIFIDLSKHQNAKIGSDAQSAARDIAVLISKALQSNADINELAKSMTRGQSSEPRGLAGAVIDAVMLELNLDIKHSTQISMF